jgi:hypothetical protein
MVIKLMQYVTEIILRIIINTLNTWNEYNISTKEKQIINNFKSLNALNK